MVKIRRNITVDDDVWNALQQTDVNISDFCNSLLKYLLECMQDNDNRLAELNNEMVDLKTRIYCEHLRIAHEYEDDKEQAEINTEMWKEFLEVSEDYSYGINLNKEFLDKVIKTTGIHESKLYEFANWIHEYQGSDEDKVYNSFSYALNKYNETTKSSKIFRDSKEIIL